MGENYKDYLIASEIHMKEFNCWREIKEIWRWNRWIRQWAKKRGRKRTKIRKRINKGTWKDRGVRTCKSKKKFVDKYTHKMEEQLLKNYGSKGISKEKKESLISKKV